MKRLENEINKKELMGLCYLSQKRGGEVSCCQAVRQWRNSLVRGGPLFFGLLKSKAIGNSSVFVVVVLFFFIIYHTVGYTRGFMPIFTHVFYCWGELCVSYCPGH